MLKTIVVIVILILLIGLIVIGAFAIFLIQRRSDLIDQVNYYKSSFDTATQEITRISIQNLKLKRELTLNKQQCDDTEITLDLNSILDRVSRIGYDNLTKSEQDFLNNISNE